MMKAYFMNLFLTLGLVLSTLVGCAQSNPILIIDYPAMPGHYSVIPKDVNETSGLILFGNNLWTHNDSKGAPEIYGISKESGSIIQRVIIENGQNVDWEDIAHDESFIYIGDFGNNNGNRRDLKIYRVKKSDISDAKKVTVRAEEIRFAYSDQTSFEAERGEHDFDCESLIVYGDSLIIFTKNWGDGRTRLYKLPKIPGDYILEPVAGFNADGLVTGADFNNTTGNLVLLGYKDRIPFIYLFTGFTGYSFKSPAIYRFDFPRMKGYQTEGIAWLDTDSVIITNESRKEIEQAAHLVNLKKIIDLAPPARD